MADPQYDRLDEETVQQIPENDPKTLRITNGSAADTKTIRIYTGTHRIGRRYVTLDVLAAFPANRIDVAPPLPPETAEIIANDTDLTVVEI